MVSGRRASSRTVKSYVPERGDIVWLDFNPQAGHEQRGKRPAFTVSPREYNKRVGLGLFCPITSNIKGYPFEVTIPQKLKVGGAVLSDQLKSLDWKARRASFVCKAPVQVIEEVKARIVALVE